jgi:hypothetical protein
MSYAATRKELADKMDDDMLPCIECQKPTKRETRSYYGGRCFGCYTAYCATGARVEPRGETIAQREIKAGMKRRTA